jgi:hypothetical protein
MNWGCLIHGHEIIRYDRQLAWECIRCLKQWPMSKELVSATGVYAKRYARKEALQPKQVLQEQESVDPSQSSVSALQDSKADLKNPSLESKKFWPLKKGQSFDVKGRAA